jgi:hypothetical protein
MVGDERWSENCLKEEDVVMTETQPRAPGRLVTLNPFELGAPPRETASAPDVGCVDWYLYPVSRKAHPTGTRNVRRGGVAAPSRENRSA